MFESGRVLFDDDSSRGFKIFGLILFGSGRVMIDYKGSKNWLDIIREGVRS
jgi:hypothetical protein